jgi:hypothetical protein
MSVAVEFDQSFTDHGFSLAYDTYGSSDARSVRKYDHAHLLGTSHSHHRLDYLRLDAREPGTLPAVGLRVFRSAAPLRTGRPFLTCGTI